jgi:hypothetical protein
MIQHFLNAGPESDYLALERRGLPWTGFYFSVERGVGSPEAVRRIVKHLTWKAAAL